MIMETKTLNGWAELLLDMGKRNNLINFKHTKLGTAEVIAPDMETLLKQSTHSAVFEVYDPKLEEQDDAEDGFLPGEDGAKKTARGASEQVLSKEEYRAAYEHKLKKGQVLVYHPEGKPLQAFKNISKKGQSAMEETGVNILYLAFGFIHWTESETIPYEMQAPVLLAPAFIEQESALDPFRIRISDDEIIVNPTFAYKLQNERNIKLPEFDEEEDIGAYFDQLDSLFAKLKWTVSRDCRIGLFSFLKINMYQDLKDHAEMIAQSPNVCAVMGEFVDRSEEEQECSEPMEMHHVVDADSSQMEAIKTAKQGKSFVLQGPPGTGKSQTITNMIAECLADGKTVLFVSEKLAALNVVYDKLKKAGLEEFCLELHSHKANKKQVIDELCRTLKTQKSVVSERAKRELEIKKNAQDLLDRYVSELHTVRPVINKSLYGMYEELSACRTAPDFEFVIPDIQTKGEEAITEAERLLRRYRDCASLLGYDYRQCEWYGFIGQDTSYQGVIRLKEDLRAAIDFYTTLREIAFSLKQTYGITVNSAEAVERYRRFFDLLKTGIFVCPSLLKLENLHHLIGDVECMKALAAVISEKRAYIGQYYDEEVYHLDGSAFYKQLHRQFSGWASRFGNKEYKNIIQNLKRCRLNGKKPKYKEALDHMEALHVYQVKLAEYERYSTESLGAGYQGIDTDFDALLAELHELQTLAASKIEYGEIPTLTSERFAAIKEEFAKASDRIQEVFSASEEARMRLGMQFDRNLFHPNQTALDKAEEKCRLCLANIDKLDSWRELSRLMENITEATLHPFLNAVLSEHMAIEQIPAVYKKAFYTQWVDAVFQKTPILMELSRISHDEAVKAFQEKDVLHFDINKAKIRASVSAKRPSLDMIVQGSAVSVLLREGEKKRKQKSIRRLLSEIGDLALTIKPCFLMSPLSVSTFLSPDMKFDTVIFDEASQIFPQDAIGTIYRGKQLIVVGDSRQMPPSNFFHTSADADEDGEDETITDFESILDLCSVSFPQRRLKWHYRSRSEELIAFSNRHFYDNDLVTFPSAKGNRQGAGVDYHYVDGVFDRRTKTNKAEAEYIVDLIDRHIEEHPERSLGVVAFSAAQQDMIERILYKRRLQNPAKEAFFKADRAEPFFVKNLETVQGDERDTIIFSIAYAKDEYGKLLLNFGPINRMGGERRLNVAVTRAKCNVQLVTSMHYTDIDLSRTKSVGAKLLRQYLEYAENGISALQKSAPVSSFDHFDSEFEREVCDFLRGHGYEVDTQVGCSSFRIDLGLKLPNTSDYVLAIECDGASYHSSKTARDRDRLRQTVLENMGWTFYRIWSTDWFRNRKTEQERLLKAAQEAIDNAVVVPKMPKAKEPEVSFEEEAKVKHFEFPKYQVADISSLEAKYHRVADIVHGILETEAPLEESWLLKRLVHLYDREKVTSVVTREFEEDMRSCAALGIIRKNGFLYLKDKEIPMLRVPDGKLLRDIKYISPEELSLGLRALLEQNVSVEKMSLYRLISHALGFHRNRIGEADLKRLEEALVLLKDEMEIDGDTISWKASH